MHRSQSHIVALAALLALSATPLARAASLVDVYEAARNHDPVVAGARAGLDVNRQTVPQARAAFLPSINASTSTGRSDFKSGGADTVESNTDSWNVGLQQSIVNVESWFNYRSAQTSVRGAEFQFGATEQQLISRTIQAYLNVLRADALLESARAQEAAVKRQLEQVQQRFDVGLVAITDVLEAQAVFDDAVVQRIQAVGDHDIRFEDLRTLTGQPYVAIDSLSEKLPIKNPEPNSAEEWVAIALETNLNIKIAESNLQAAEQSYRARRSAHLPTLSGSISTGHSETDRPNIRDVGVSESDTTNYALTLSVPIFQGGRTHSQAVQARAQAEQSRQQLLDQRQTISRDTRNLLRSVSTDVARVNARLKAIQSAQSALDATKTGYEVGTRNIVDVLQAQNRLYSSQFDYADSRYNYIIDLMLLKQAAGSLADEDLGDLNGFVDPNDPVTRLNSLRARGG
ncbi:MAG: TolC family outer membrane protein [Gammaproteobacteria bacterium]|nr:TolC family outer membrane protein [Gammaproteobacteria bacterium]